MSEKLLSLSKTHPPIKTTALARQVFAGTLLHFSSTPQTRILLRKVRGIIRKCFDLQNPLHAHQVYTRAVFLRRAEQAQKRVNSSECKPYFAEVLQSFGLPLSSIYWDTLGLRVAPPVRHRRDIDNRGYRSYVPVHRDTWGAGFQAQINWWSPIWPLTAKRTMGFYPSYFCRPLPNSTAEWSFRDYLASRRNAQANQKGRAALYPSAPSATAMPDESAVPLLVPPSEWACFSSAQLHSSIMNTTTLTRFSLEIRTLDLQDLRQGRGAPNVDNDGKDLLYGLFSSALDGSPLKDKWQRQ